MGKGGDVEAPGASNSKAEAGTISSTLNALYKASTRIVGLRQSSSHSEHSNAIGSPSRRERSTGPSTASTSGKPGSEAAASKAGKPQLTEEEKTFWNARKLKLSADAKRIWALGIVIVIGGQYFGSVIRGFLLC
jgi:hypothetical protein